MPKNDRRLDEMRTLSRQWREKIDDLETQVDEMEGREQLATIELLDHMKQQQIIVDQYLELLQKKGGASWRKSAAELDHMLEDIDASYRRALVYFD